MTFGIDISTYQNRIDLEDAIRAYNLGIIALDEIDKFIQENDRKSIPIGMFGVTIGKEMYDLDILKYL